MCEAKSLPEDYNQGEKTVIEDIFVENDYLKLYPNPTQDHISIELQSEIDAKIESVEIFNLNGIDWQGEGCGVLKCIDPVLGRDKLCG